MEFLFQTLLLSKAQLLRDSKLLLLLLLLCLNIDIALLDSSWLLIESSILELLLILELGQYLRLLLLSLVGWSHLNISIQLSLRVREVINFLGNKLTGVSSTVSQILRRVLLLLLVMVSSKLLIHILESKVLIHKRN